MQCIWPCRLQTGAIEMRGDERQAPAWPSKVWRGGGREGTGSGEVKVGGVRPGHSGASACIQGSMSSLIMSWVLTPESSLLAGSEGKVSKDASVGWDLTGSRQDGSGSKAPNRGG